MNRQAARCFLAFIASTVCGSAMAHHSYAQFDRCQSMSIEGEIGSIAWANPHVVVTLKTGDATAYRVEWWDLNRLARAGVSTDSLKVGDRVVVTGSLHRDPELHVVTLLTAIRRPSDGWSWLRPSSLPPSCAREQI